MGVVLRALFLVFGLLAHPCGIDNTPPPATSKLGLISNVAAAVKDTVVAGYNAVTNADFHDISGKVAEVAGEVNRVSGTIAKGLGTIANLTAPITPLWDAARTMWDSARKMEKIANVVNTASGIMQSGARWVHDNTKPGETVGYMLGPSTAEVETVESQSATEVFDPQAGRSSTTRCK